MTKAEIANAIRDFSLDVENMRNADGAMIVKQMREYADRVEFEVEGSAPWAPVVKPVSEPGAYLHGEER